MDLEQGWSFLRLREMDGGHGWRAWELHEMEEPMGRGGGRSARRRRGEGKGERRGVAAMRMAALHGYARQSLCGPNLQHSRILGMQGLGQYLWVVAVGTWVGPSN